MEFPALPKAIIHKPCDQLLYFYAGSLVDAKRLAHADDIIDFDGGGISKHDDMWRCSYCNDLISINEILVDSSIDVEKEWYKTCYELFAKHMLIGDYNYEPYPKRYYKIYTTYSSNLNIRGNFS